MPKVTITVKQHPIKGPKVQDPTPTPVSTEPSTPPVTTTTDTTPAAIAISGTNAGTVGQQVQFTAVVTNASSTVLGGVAPDAWHSSDLTVATIDSTGLLTVVGAGTTNITATITSPALTSNSITFTGSAVSPPPPIQDNTPAAITISGSTSAVPGTQVQYTAMVTNSGSAVLTGVQPDAWHSSNTAVATVSSTGLVTILAEGTTQITATIASPSLTSNAITLTGTPLHLVVTASATSATAGQAVTLSAQITDQNGNAAPLSGQTISWAIVQGSGGTLSAATSLTNASGLATVQLTLALNESYVVSATDAAGHTAASPTITTIVSGTSSHPNEPAGFVQKRYQPFDTAENSDFRDASVNPGTKYTIVTDATNPGSSANVGRIEFDTTMNGGEAPASVGMRTDFSPVLQQVYIAFYIKLSANWQSPIQSGANKILYGNKGTPANQSTIGSLEYLSWGWSLTEQELQPAPVLEGIVQVVDTGDGIGNVGTNTLRENQQSYDSSSAVDGRDVWVLHEWLLTYNTPGQSNGSIKWWCDHPTLGHVLYGDYPNRVQWSNTVGDGFVSFRWEPTYGGSTIPPDRQQFMYLKDLYISGPA